MRIPFNIPFLTGKELEYIHDAINRRKVSGNGYYTQKCQRFFEERYGFGKCLMTTSCTDALEMSAMLINIQAGDEVIVPSYTFVSSALAFAREGANIVFCDSREDHPGMDEDALESLITNKTRAIVAVHYAGVATDMNKIMRLSEKYNLFIIEDAAQAIDASFEGKPLGSFGHFACFSFHETKNIQAGEGGMLVINDSQFERRAEILWEKGTNRAEFFRGEVNKYNWIDLGSSFLPSDIIAAFLYAQLEQLEDIQNVRKNIWMTYHRLLGPLAEKGYISLPFIPEYAKNNAHMFYILCNKPADCQGLKETFEARSIKIVSHYINLHLSPYYLQENNPISLPNSERYTDCLLRLPFFYSLTLEEVEEICGLVKNYFQK